MAALSANRIAWTYTSDSGVDYRVAAQKAVTDQAKSGGSAAAATLPAKPGGLKMRRVSCSDGAGHSRTTPVYTVDAPIATPGTAINLNAAGDVRAMTTSNGPISESHSRTTKQST